MARKILVPRLACSTLLVWFGSSLFKSLVPFVPTSCPCVSSFIVKVLTSPAVLNYQLGLLKLRREPICEENVI